MRTRVIHARDAARLGEHVDLDAAEQRSRELLVLCACCHGDSRSSDMDKAHSLSGRFINESKCTERAAMLGRPDRGVKDRAVSYVKF
jgi:hypothetical protein